MQFINIKTALLYPFSLLRGLLATTTSFGCVRLHSWKFSIGSGVQLSAFPNGRINIRDKNNISKGSILSAIGYGYIDIGINTFLNSNCIISSIDKVSIGKDCLLGNNVSIYDHDHIHSDYNTPINKQGLKSSPVIIEDNCWIGAHSVLTKGICIGENSIIGAGSIVTKSIPSNSIAVGNPCRVIKKRINVFNHQG